jgi:hypothetical protein
LCREVFAESFGVERVEGGPSVAADQASRHLRDTVAVELCSFDTIA